MYMIRMEDILLWKITLDERHFWMGDDVGWKTTFDGRRPLIQGLFDVDLFRKIINLFIEEETCGLARRDK